MKNNKKREAALKNETGGDEKHLFFLLGLIKNVAVKLATWILILI